MCFRLQESERSYEIRKPWCGCLAHIQDKDKCIAAAVDNSIYFAQEEGKE